MNLLGIKFRETLISRNGGWLMTSDEKPNNERNIILNKLWFNLTTQAYLLPENIPNT